MCRDERRLDMVKITTTSPKGTYGLGQKLAALMKGGAVICLEGDLGAGKTLFVQGLAAGLHVQDEVTSPTFSIMNFYEGDVQIVHFDLYRLESVDELEEIGFYEYSEREGGVVVIEWPSKFPDELPENYLLLSIEHGGEENERVINVCSKGGKYDDLLEELKVICEF